MVAGHLAVCLLSLAAAGLAADPIDWVNIDYVVSKGKSNSDTANARSSIASRAASAAQKSPWTIETNGINPPSGDPRDYLSWAPYHWPDCNWCSKGSTHYVSPNNTSDGQDSDTGSPDDSGDYPDDSPDDDMDYPGYPDDSSSQASADSADTEDLKSEIAAVNFIARPPSKRDSFPTAPKAPHRMRRIHRLNALASRECTGTDDQPGVEDSVQSSSPTLSVQPTGDPSASMADIPSLPTDPPIPDVPRATGLFPTTTTANKVAGTQAPAEAPAKTQQGKSNCTPSPTKSLAPSATWTTCPYVVRDGKVNPDTDIMKGPDAAQGMSQSVIYNAVAYALQKTSSYSQSVASAIDAFFLSSTTGMHPNINFGQLVRGPGKDHLVGTFTGILDLRGMVKVSNAIQLMRASKAPDWTSARDTAMINWMKSYVSWLQTSNIGKSTASKANNHLTFYISQLAAVKMALGDNKGAANTLQKYFNNQFLDQIAQSGEQPFESVRTRPFHYRCFNLEAMIANAKMGDQLGLNLWVSKSKYGATIQTAVDYMMRLDPNSEEIDELFPHVAATAAAYGDPSGKYAFFLQKKNPNYKSNPFYFYDQTAALSNSPAGKTKRSDDYGELTDSSSIPAASSSTSASIPETSSSESVPTAESNSTTTAEGSAAAMASSPMPFECPAVFKDTTEVELEDGLFVTCDQLKPFYEIALPVDTATV
ncbi:chondroitin AC/alginate lyase [Trametopsis cervina]|nr:chondroitin AC/alginate lyase [Trametopsis cervina]